MSGFGPFIKGHIQKKTILKLFTHWTCFVGEFVFLSMFLQEILLVVVFVAALSYLGFIVYKSFQAKSGCASGCGKCGAVDFAKIEKQLKEKKL